MSVRMSNIDQFKKIAHERLCDGQLIKQVNEYAPDPEKVQQALEQNKSLADQENPVKTVVLENIIYIGFDTMLLLLMKSFRAFLQEVKEPYVLVCNSITHSKKKDKSDIWVLLLLLRYGPKFLGEAYRDPVEILQLPEHFDFNAKPIDATKTYVFCDDVIYSGTQLHYRLDALRMTCHMANLRVRAYVVCAAIGPQGIKRLDKCIGAAHIYGRRVPSLQEIVDTQPYLYIKDRVKKHVQTLPQPFNDTIYHMNKIPLYLEHKMPDIMSSFPDILIDVVSNCKLDNAGDTNAQHKLIRDGSSANTFCAHPFYKVVDKKKGEHDCKNEKSFVQTLLARAHTPTSERHRAPKPTLEKITLPPGLPGVPAPRRPRTVYVGAHGKKYVRVKGTFVHLAGLRGPVYKGSVGASGSQRVPISSTL